MSNFNTKIVGVAFVLGEGNDEDMLSITFEDNTLYRMPMTSTDDKFTVANKLNVLALAIVTDEVLATHYAADIIPSNLLN